MKIAYIVFEPLSIETGVNKKIKNQIKHWILNCHEVKLFIVNPITKIWDELADISHEIIVSDRSLLKGLVDKWNPDIVYFRFLVRYHAMTDVMDDYPTVIEVNSDDITENWGRFKQKRWFMTRYWKYRMARKRLLRSSNGLITVTNELGSKFHFIKQPKITISNGIDLSDYLSTPSPNNSRLNLVFIGKSIQKWNRIEMIIFLAIKFPQWDFNLIGIEESEIKESKPNNIKFHGVMTKDKYEELMTKADIAIGTLGLYEKNMTEACPLKVREYLAYGIPTIIAYKDADFPNGAEFILQLPNEPDNIISNLEKIRKFIEEWKGKRVPREEILHLDVSLKEKERLEFFRKILNK